MGEWWAVADRRAGPLDPPYESDPMDDPDPPPTEPATSFKWVIVTAAVVWTLGAVIIVVSLWTQR